MTIRNTLLAALALLGLGGAAQAREPFVVTGQGEEFAVQYDPAYTGNIVGGGYAAFVGNGHESQIVYADPTIGRRAPGIPVMIGGEHAEIAYLPQTGGASLLAARQR